MNLTMNLTIYLTIYLTMRNIPHGSPRRRIPRRPDHFGGDITETFGASAGEQTKVSHGKKDTVILVNPIGSMYGIYTNIKGVY